jgi:hypothetical protein
MVYSALNLASVLSYVEFVLNLKISRPFILDIVNVFLFLVISALTEFLSSLVK